MVESWETDLSNVYVLRCVQEREEDWREEALFKPTELDVESRSTFFRHSSVSLANASSEVRGSRVNGMVQLRR